MQICSVCSASAPDDLETCPKCQADLREQATVAVYRQKLIDNPRVYAINIAVALDACPACQAIQGTYTKENLPVLPLETCAHQHGCRCKYQPLLEEIFP